MLHPLSPEDEAIAFKMKYVQVEWIHNDNNDPVWIYSEIDSDRWEHRKIEVFRDGHQGFADSKEEFGGSMLGLEPWPDLNVLAADPEFDIAEITVHEFEKIWANRRARLKPLVK